MVESKPREARRQHDELRSKELVWAIEQSSEGIATASLDGVFLFVNETWAKMHGYEVEELVGQPIIGLDSLTDQENLPNVWQEIQEKGFWRGELLRKRKDGSFFPAIMTSTLIKDDEGKPVCIMGTCVDINERKREFEELKKKSQQFKGLAEERTAELTATNEELQREIKEKRIAEKKLKLFSEAVENAPDGIQITDLDGYIIYSNRSVKEITGFSPEEHYGKHVNEMNEDPEFAGSVIIPEIKKTGRWIGELMVKHKEGRNFPIWLTTSMVRDRDGKPLGMVGILRDIIAQKEAEKKLEEAHTFLQSVIDGVAEPIMVIDPDYRVILMNLAAREFSSGSSGSMLCHQISHSRDTPCNGTENICPLEMVRQSGRPVIVEHEHKRPDGTNHYFEILASPLTGPEGEFLGIIESSRDVTGRKKGEEALKDSEERYRTLFEESPISLWEEDISEIKKYIDGLRLKGIQDIKTYFENNPEEVRRCADMVKVVDVNKATLELFKAGNKEELMEGLSSIFTEESFEVFKEELIAYAGGKTIFENEDVVKTLKGDKIHINIKLSFIPGQERTYSRRLVSIIDITESKLAEEALKFEKDKLRLLYENNPDAVLILDRDFRILYENKTVESIVGIPRAGLLGKKCFEVIMDRPSLCNGCLVKDVFREKEPKSRIKHEFTATGKENWLWQLFYPILDMEGNVDSVVEIARDITEMKRAEEAVNKYTKQLEEANRIKSLFTDVLSHDILNPLNVANGYSELLKEKETDPHKKIFLETIKRNLKKVRETTENAAIFSKLESLESIVFEELDLKEIIDEVVEEFKPVIADAGMILENNIIDPLQLKANTIIEDVFSNLISNAIKYAQEGKKVIISSEDKGDLIRIKVMDFGEGISDTYKDDIFERFQRKEKMGVKGSGLGLAIAKRIMKLHQGAIWVEDNPEGGAVFIVEIPKS